MKIKSEFVAPDKEMEPYKVANLIRQAAVALEDELRGEKKENGKWWVTWAKFRRVQSMNDELRTENKRLRDILDNYLKRGK